MAVWEAREIERSEGGKPPKNSPQAQASLTTYPLTRSIKRNRRALADQVLRARGCGATGILPQRGNLPRPLCADALYPSVHPSTRFRQHLLSSPPRPQREARREGKYPKTDEVAVNKN